MFIITEEIPLGRFLKEAWSPRSYLGTADFGQKAQEVNEA
jgi:hypothetical protein